MPSPVVAEQVYIVLFRGVGGATRLPSAPLREALAKAGFGNVTTYIATGNVVLISGLSSEAVRDRIARIASKELGFEKEIFVLTADEWRRIVRENPFPEGEREPRSLHAFILAAKPTKAVTAALAAKASGRERIAVKGRALYFHAPDGFGGSKLPAAIEKAFAGATTARNWNTIAKLGELAEAYRTPQHGADTPQRRGKQV
jgi:uncharacterized protein (DUF1697 family)